MYSPQAMRKKALSHPSHYLGSVMVDGQFPPPPAYSLQETGQNGTATVEQPSVTLPSHFIVEEWEPDNVTAINPSETQTVSGHNVGSSSRPLPERPPWEQGSHDHLVYVEPLRIRKKTEPRISNSSNDHSGWDGDPELADPLSSSSIQTASASISPRAESFDDTPAPLSPNDLSVPPVSADAEDDHPPPFTAVGPSLDGPPYEPLAYHGNGSNPPSPLTSPLPVNLSLPAASPIPFHSPSPEPQEQFVYASVPDPSVRRHPPQPFPSPLPPPSNTRRASFSPSTSSPEPVIPRMDFNPLVAYGRGGLQGFPRGQQPLRPIDAAAFYNSAVSAHLPSSSQANRPHLMNLPNQSVQSTYYSQAPTMSRNSGYRSSASGVFTTVNPPWSSSVPMSPPLTSPLPRSNDSQSGSYPPQAATSAYPAYPRHPSQPAIPNPSQYTNRNVVQDRWATSEEQFTRSFR